MEQHIPPTGEAGDEGPAQPDDRALFAEFLVSARRRSGRSLGEIASSTKVSTRYLEALEEGRVELLPRGVYRRAIVRNYATAVGLDPAIVLERFSRIFGIEAVLTEWQGIPQVTPPPRATGVLRQTLALSPVTGLRMPSFRFLAISAQTLPPVQKVREQLRPVALAASITIFGAVAAHLMVDLSRTAPRSVTPTLRSVQTLERAPTITTAGAATSYAVQPIGGVTAVASNQTRIARAADAPLSAGAISTSLRYADGVPVQPSAPQAPSPAESRLVITSQPAGARVTVNGIGWGVTPITIRHLSPGDKMIRVTKDGYVGQERQVRLGDDGGTSAVRLTLRPRS